MYTVMALPNPTGVMAGIMRLTYHATRSIECTCQAGSNLAPENIRLCHPSSRCLHSLLETCCDSTSYKRVTIRIQTSQYKICITTKCSDSRSSLSPNDSSDPINKLPFFLITRYLVKIVSKSHAKLFQIGQAIASQVKTVISTLYCPRKRKQVALSRLGENKGFAICMQIEKMSLASLCHCSFTGLNSYTEDVVTSIKSGTTYSYISMPVSVFFWT